MPFGKSTNENFIYGMFNFQGEVDDELSFNCGDIIYIIETDEEFKDGWWIGKCENGNQGLFPESYTCWSKPIAPGVAPVSAVASAATVTAVADQEHPKQPPQHTPINSTMSQIEDAINDISTNHPDNENLLAPIVESTNSNTSSQITLDHSDNEDDPINANARSLLAKKNLNPPTSLQFGSDSDENLTPTHSPITDNNDQSTPNPPFQPENSFNSYNSNQSPTPPSPNTTDIPNWSLDNVLHWAKHKNFDDYVCEKLLQHDISGDVLLQLDTDSLKEIDILAFGKRVKLANAIKDLRILAGLDQGVDNNKRGSETSKSSGHNQTPISNINTSSINNAPSDPPTAVTTSLPSPHSQPGLSRTASATNSLRRAFSGHNYNSTNSPSSATSPTIQSPLSPRTPSLRKRTSDSSAFFGVGSKGNPRKPAPRYSGASNETEKSDKEGWSAARLLGSKRSLRNINGGGRPSTSPQPQQSQPQSSFANRVSLSTDNANTNTNTNADTRRSVVDLTHFQSRDGTALQKIGGCDCKGWLKKRGERYGWKMRYFVLKGSQLFYLKNENDTQLKGFIQLNGFKVLADESNSSRHQFAFKISHERERDTHHFASEEKSVTREWMNALMKASIVRDIGAPVVSSCTIPTIPLDKAQTMFPPPRPPSPTSRERVQRANARDNPDSLSPQDAQVLMAGASEGGTQGGSHGSHTRAGATHPSHSSPTYEKKRTTSSSFGNLSSSFGNEDRDKDF
ncbi:hypothetical protein E3P86_03716 [Wallemia ichthyophaga]|uniref:Protein BOI2 n=1 Tax=Wallemia ichthyophaga TaxID=245174 RepID=A0A4T0IME7_WALIC|nr:hypothetical protein E3P86_03716 [Wallemia ichthyophaga]